MPDWPKLKKILNKKKGNNMKLHGIEIKDGYLLVVKTKDEIHNMTVVSNSGNELACVTPHKHFWNLTSFNEDGRHWVSEVVAIYGRTYNKLMLDNSTTHRDLLWERKETKKMTVAEICAALGYDVEIVKEGQA